MTTEALRLYYYPGVCSLAPHIALREAGATFELARVDLRTRKTEAGEDFAAVNPKGYVPALRLPDGEVLTETAVLLQYVADTWPEAGLAPLHGGLERVRFDERLIFIATELHKGFAPFTIMPNAGDEAKRWASQRLTARVELLARDLGERPFFHGDAFTVLDAYAFFALRVYPKLFAAELPANLAAFQARVAARPAVVAAFAAEGLKA
ncbi:glutathione S-transferase N-terminal domain-containing protein [Nannocystis bainbridge]|uniref:Glutathione S-transferase N-terminal domain-containing protein n=1 Tax=Nannocystis bainbridge TaxID=2995303 RepID=A0ABT5DVF2_9BACT|nr:glutathione S-transferase N-terminal domain-containing protein [Nannocystis bainbridge]MDC0716402.1 glutathione S-transferase N-terminal domain-containing protein [Nannocystis bainbridge]